MSGPLSSPRPIFGVKIGVASWVSTGNPNFNPKNRPEVNKLGPGNKSVINFDEKITKNKKKIGRIH
jgi:hypothetical protein